jgi:hypothetical protein
MVSCFLGFGESLVPKMLLAALLEKILFLSHELEGLKHVFFKKFLSQLSFS